MTVALIGLLGVIAGALLGGLVNYALEVKKQKVAARVAGLLISSELKFATIRMDSAIKTEGWWQGTLKTEGKVHLEKLAVFMSETELESTFNAYRIMESWNTERNAKETPGPDLVKVKKDCENINVARKNLEGGLKQLNPSRFMLAVRRNGAIVSLAVVGVALLVGILVERTAVDELSVASALESALPADSIVECDQAGHDWRCNAYDVSEARMSCLPTGHAIRPTRMVKAASIQAGGSCTLEATRTYEVTEGLSSLHAIPMETSGAVERAALGESIRRLPKPSETLLGRAWNWISGK